MFVPVILNVPVCSFVSHCHHTIVRLYRVYDRRSVCLRAYLSALSVTRIPVVSGVCSLCAEKTLLALKRMSKEAVIKNPKNVTRVWTERNLMSVCASTASLFRSVSRSSFLSCDCEADARKRKQALADLPANLDAQCVHGH